jgi:hypothetical protein
MVAYTDSYGFYKNSAGFGSNYTNRLSVMEIDLDFAKIAAARTAISTAASFQLSGTTSDTLAIGTLPLGSYVISASVLLLRVHGATATISVGVSGATTLWVNAFDLNSAVNTSAGVTNGARFLTANTDILLTCNTSGQTYNTARVKVALLVANMGTDQGTIPSP